MAQEEPVNTPGLDAFSPIANHYDAIMEHVDYARWRHIAGRLGDLLPRPILHLDAGCGTGVLMEQLAESGWHSFGIDLSPSMLRVARHRRKLTALACADVCALPFQEKFHLITCLFDSVNFLLREEQVHSAMESFFRALKPGGLLYFDIVTRRMISDHFNNECWMEDHGRFRSSWRSIYHREQRLCETRVRINSGTDSVTRERVYDPECIQDAVGRAGLSLLSMRDAYTWKKPGRAVTRIDFVAVKGGEKDLTRRFEAVERDIRAALIGRQS